MASLALPPTILPRVGNLLRMLASPADGEALNAARALGRTLGGVGLDLNDLADAVEHPPEPMVIYRDATRERPYRGARPGAGTVEWSPSRKREVRLVLERGISALRLTDWERSFVESILFRLHDPRGRLSHRQVEVVERIVAKIEGRH